MSKVSASLLYSLAASESMHRALHVQASPAVNCKFEVRVFVPIFSLNFYDTMFNALSDLWAFSTCTDQPGFVVPKPRDSQNHNRWLFSSSYACYNYVDGTEERIAIDHRCKPEQTTTFLTRLQGRTTISDECASLATQRVRRRCNGHVDG